MGFLIRLTAAFALLAATYNPTGLSYTHWALENWETRTSVAVLAGLILLVAYIVFLTAVLRGIGSLGVILILGVSAALTWVAYDFGLLDLQNPTQLTWIGLVAVSFVLAIGMYWGILWRNISGQVEVDDEE